MPKFTLSDAWKLYKLKGIIGRILGDKKMIEKLKSRKFIIVIITAVLTAVNSALGSPVPDTMMQWIIGLIGGWVGVEGIVDTAMALKQPSVTLTGTTTPASAKEAVSDITRKPA